MNITNKISKLKPIDDIFERHGALAGKLVSTKDIAPRQVTMEEEFIPFLNVSKADERHWRNNQPAWKFALPDLKAAMKRGVSFPYVKEIDFTINPHTEKLLKVHSSWPAGIPAIKPMPSPIEEEKQMMQVKEKFTGVPDGPLLIDFETALKKVQESGPALPNSAKQIVAYLVLHSTIRYTDRAVWVIHTRGIIPFEAKLPAAHNQPVNSIPEDLRNHVRHVIDAETGQWLFSDTTPQPVS
jgi:hypothetical protein